MMHEKHIDSASVKRNWLKKLGFAGFMFFLIKGLLWLIVPAAIAYFSLN